MNDDISGSNFIVSPLEGHDFKEGSDGFNCSVCHRPRALHQHDGFTPNKQLPQCPMWVGYTYSRHPRWYRPGTLRLNREEQAEVDRIYSKRRVA